jgi:ATP-dependent helicase/nuclease subunit A
MTCTTQHPELALDTINRQQALDCSQSFIIEAPAGAGKTELLTQRFLALLTTVQQPEEIVALTFTNKAAAEMRERILSSLETAHRGVPPTEPHKLKTFALSQQALERDAQLQWGLLQTPSRLQVTTLDALCSRLARHMPLLSRLGSQPGIASNPSIHYQAAAQDTLQLLHSPHPIAETLTRVLGHFDNDAQRLQAMLETMLASRDQWLPHMRRLQLQDAELAWAELVEWALSDIAQVFDRATQTPLIEVGRLAASELDTQRTIGQSLSTEAQRVLALLDRFTPLQAQLSDLPAWRGLATLFLTRGGDLRATAPSDLGVCTSEAKDAFKGIKPLLAALKDQGHSTLLERALNLPQPHYSQTEQQLLQDLIDVLKVANAQLWLHFQAAREVDFIDMAQQALEALGDELTPTDLQLQLDYRISHLLIDEFQDTSPTQIRLIERLTTGWEEQSQKTLFLVGDPMQSIYRFRKADVGLFIRVREHGIGQLHPKALQLYRNNRSDPAVVDWVNQSFPHIFPPQDHMHLGAVQFTAAHASRSPQAFVGVHIHPFLTGQSSGTLDNDTDATDSRVAFDPDSHREALHIIQLIRQAQSQDPKGSIGILVRARNHLHALVAELSQQQIPFQAVEIQALADRQVIADLISLTRAVLHRADRVHWLALLRAPWCGLTWTDLHTLVAHNTHSTVWSLIQQDALIAQLSVDGQQRLLHVRSVLEEAYARRIQQRPRRWIEGIWQCLGGPLCLAQPADLLDATAYFDALDRITQHGQLQIERLDDEVARLFAAPDPQAGTQLQLMTIHKSKGLEFDTVILPSLHRKAGNDDKHLLLWDEVLCRDGRERLVVASNTPRDLADNPNAHKYPLLQSFEHARARHESQRLLYVGVTRAKQRLHLLGQVSLDKSGHPKQPTPSSLLHLLWPVAQPVFEAATTALVHPTTNSASTTGPAVNTTTDHSLANFNHLLVRLSTPHIHPSLCISDIDAKPTLHSSNSKPITSSHSLNSAVYNPLAARTGTLIHKYLELIAHDGLGQWPLSRLSVCLPAMQHWFVQQGHNAAESQSAAADVMGQLMTTLSSSDGRWVLSPHPQARSEWAQTTHSHLATHIIDRTFVYKGTRWIIDYKTTTDTQPILQQWSEQLLRYVQLFGAEHPIQSAIFFTDSGRLVRLDF